MKTLIKGALVITILFTGCGKTPEQAADSIKELRNYPIYKQLTVEIINGLKDEELEQTIFDNISSSFASDSREAPEKIKSMTVGQKAIYVTWIVEAEITGGGLKHYYSHSGKMLAPFVKEAFETIHAGGFAEVMEQANLVYSSLQQKEKPKGDAYTALENRFEDLSAKESLDALKVQYIRDHVEEFTTREVGH